MEQFLDEIPKLDFSGPMVYLPVRHHSPACAFHVAKTIRELQPVAVLIEGPHPAGPLIPFLTHPELRPPVAIFTTFVRQENKERRDRFSAYYPICDYSPEWVAVRTAQEIGAECDFIDLSFPEMVQARSESAPSVGSKPDNLLAERSTKQNRFIQAVCQRMGTRDADDLWDCLYELDYREKESRDFFRNVLAYCLLLRRGETMDGLAADGTVVRENAMRRRIAEYSKRFPDQRIVVVTGGFHTVALLDASNGDFSEDPRKPAKKSDDKTGESQISLIRYGFEQLDRLNGYASGMPAPEYYQRDWTSSGDDANESFLADLVVELGRICRKKNIAISTADEIGALEHCRRLAELRRHVRPSREDFCDAIRSVFVKGADDSDGLPVLALARKLLAGDRVGQVPAEAGRPPILADFHRQAGLLRIGTDSGTGKETALDLYRKRRDREISRFFRQLEFLGVPFASWKQGPDFLFGNELHRVREIWNYRWTPETESSLIVASIYGSTVRDAAREFLLEKFRSPENPAQSGRADHAVRLVVSACLMGLHDLSAELLDKAKTLIAEDPAFVSLVTSMELLVGLHCSREPLEAHGLAELDVMATTAYRRACFLIPDLAATAENDEDQVVDAFCTLSEAILSTGDSEEHRDLRWDGLRKLAENPDGNRVLQGAAVGILYGEGNFAGDTLLKHLRGSLFAATGEEGRGTGFLRGLLRTARSVLWQLPECVDLLHEMIKEPDETQFVIELPLLRLAFSSLTPRECDRLAKIVAERFGLTPPTSLRIDGFAEPDMLLASRINLAVQEILQQDGLHDPNGSFSSSGRTAP